MRREGEDFEARGAVRLGIGDLSCQGPDRPRPGTMQLIEPREGTLVKTHAAPSNPRRVVGEGIGVEARIPGRRGRTAPGNPRRAGPGADTGKPMPRPMQTTPPGGDAPPGELPGTDEFVDAPAPDRHTVRRMLTHAAVTAWVISLLIHLALLVIAALITYQPSRAGGAGPPGEDEVEMAVVTEAELMEIRQAALEAETPAVPDLPAPDPPSADTLASDLTSDLTGLSDVSDLSVEIGGGDVSGGSMGIAGAGGGATSFFGVEARGNRFVYIVDVSGSMSIGGRMETLRDQLISSIDALIETAQFCVVAFNHAAWPLGGETKWMSASASGRRDAIRLIRGMEPSGGTVPVPAFQQVFTLRPRPDAIYFMTDGEFNPEYADEIARLNRETKIPIHCIAYMSPGAEPIMQKIARESGGTYRYVPGGTP